MGRKGCPSVPVPVKFRHGRPQPWIGLHGWHWCHVQVPWGLNGWWILWSSPKIGNPYLGDNSLFMFMTFNLGIYHPTFTTWHLARSMVEMWKKKHWWMYDHPSGWEKWGHVGHVFEPPRFDQHLRFFSLKGPCFSGPKLPEIPQCRPHDLVSPRLVVTKSSKLMALATGRPKISHPLFFKKLHGKINRKWFGSFCLPVLGQLYKRCPFDVVSWLSLHQV